MPIPATISALAAAAALALTAVAMVAPADAGPAADPMVGAPTVGSCSTMTAAQADAQARPEHGRGHPRRLGPAPLGRGSRPSRHIG